MSSNHVVIKDVNGAYVTLALDMIMSTFATEDIKLFGMDLQTILELKLQYDKRNGPLNISPSTVRETFNRGL